MKSDPIDALIVLLELDPVIDNQLMKGIEQIMNMRPRTELVVSTPRVTAWTPFEEWEAQGNLSAFQNHPAVTPTWESLARLALLAETKR